MFTAISPNCLAMQVLNDKSKWIEFETYSLMALVFSGFQSVIGYAEVKPKPTYFGIPTSCTNLKAAGHTSSGLYSVAANSKVQNVFCDFTKSQSDPGIRTNNIQTRS